MGLWLNDSELYPLHGGSARLHHGRAGLGKLRMPSMCLPAEAWELLKVSALYVEGVSPAPCTTMVLAERLPVDEVEMEEDSENAPAKPAAPEAFVEAEQAEHIPASKLKASDEASESRAAAEASSMLGLQNHENASANTLVKTAHKAFASATSSQRAKTKASMAKQKAAMHRLFDRRTSEAAHTGHISVVAKTHGRRHQRWDLGNDYSSDHEREEDEDGDASAESMSRYQKLTEDQRQQMRVLEQELDSKHPANSTGGVLASVAEQPMLLAVAGGIGASVGNTGSINFDRDLIRRMKMQDVVVMCLLLFVYFATLSFSACLAHRQAANRSRVKFYADPRMYISTVDQAEETVFLEAFNQQPKQVHLRVTGYLPVTNNFPGSFFWRDGLYAVAFSFALDLTPWVSRASIRYPEDTDDEDEPDAGVEAQDLLKLRKFLAEDANDMAIVEMRKTIDWACWDELAMNIKHQVRQAGFQGVINIDRTEQEEMCVYKNTQWANFMHGKALKVLLALSVVGWLVYVPYMWVRCTHLQVRCAHSVKISISDFWPFIADGLSSNGFLVGEAPQAVFPAMRADRAEADSSEDDDDQARANSD
ncbi:unnamed protein product [Symbiodinium natans]|uniref:Uncharacterized protein n=1 Tax=Symbiodinium natans TaxID=878477 RepID=A0A812LTM5_9DINO|nr:unnamed protein product [Symbiodinium natans]